MLFDLSFFWQGAPSFEVANGDFMGPSLAHQLDYFQELFWDDCDLIRVARGH